MHMDNFSHVGSSHKEFDHRAPSAVDPLMTGTLQSGVSTQPTLLMQNGAGPLMMASGPASVIGAPGSVIGAPGSVIGAPGSVIGAPASVIGAPGSVLGAPAPVLSHMPMGLPPGTPSTSRVVMSTGMPVSSMGMHIGMPNGAPVSMAPVMSNVPLPPIPNGNTEAPPGSRPVTPPLQTSRPVTPTQTQPQPLGLPNGRGKLVPGRMSNTKLDSRPRKEIPSTAV